MKLKSQVACFYETGIPQEVIRLEEWPLKELTSNEVCVQMIYSPVNPADLNILEGRYNDQPKLPAVAGSEGVGRITSLGSSVKNLKAGMLVITPRVRGRWCERYVVDADEVFALPDNISQEQASMMIVNAATAYQLIHLFEKLQPGDWIIQNAANSGVGRNVIGIAKALGFRTVNIVRRKELIEDLKNKGADVVLLDSDDLKAFVETNLKNEKISLGLNSVGGQSALNISRILSQNATLVTYGAMAKQPITIENKLLIFKNLKFTGFSMRNWYLKSSKDESNSLMRKLSSLMIENTFRVPIERVYPLSEIKSAIIHAQVPSKYGKILLRLS